MSAVGKVLTAYLLNHPKHCAEQQQRRHTFSRNAGKKKQI